MADSELMTLELKAMIRKIETFRTSLPDKLRIMQRFYDAVFSAGMRAGEIATKEKAAELCEREVRPELDNFNDLNRGWNEALTYAAGAIRAGGQESGGNGDGK